MFEHKFFSIKIVAHYNGNINFEKIQPFVRYNASNSIDFFKNILLENLCHFFV